MRLLLGQDRLVAEWVAQRIERVESGEDFGPCAAIGVINSDGVIVGGVVYNNYRERYADIELSFASDATAVIYDRLKAGKQRNVSATRWLTRSIICGLLSYPFDQLHCQRVTGVTPRKATSARRFLDQFGFKREGCVRRGFGDDDAIISGLLRDEWLTSKWVNPALARAQRAGRVDHRQEHAQSARSA